MMPILIDRQDRRTAEVRANQLLAEVGLQGREHHKPGELSGGEQQRINVARSFIVDYPIMLLDEPTAFLDGENRSTVMELIMEAKGRGAAIVGIFHDDAVRRAVADRVYEMKI